MKNKLVLVVLALVSIASLGISYPKWPEVPSPTGANWLWDATNSVWRPQASTASGVPQMALVSEDGATATVDIVLPAITLATRSITLLATNTVTLLKSVASFTDGDFLLFQARGKFYWSVLSGTSASASDMQAGAFVGESGDTPIFLRLKTSANVAFVADSAAPATLTYTLGREQ